ncbi:MAG: hypothetical protein R2941_11905 [Desulfobacterales bacterium]
MIFIGHFFHLTTWQEKAGEDRRHGEFHMLAGAANQQAALALFRKRIERFRKNGSLFEGHCRIYLTKLLEFDRIPEGEALLFHFTSQAGEPFMPFIDCTVPTEESDHCTIMEWKDNVPETEGWKGELFLEFSEK